MIEMRHSRWTDGLGDAATPDAIGVYRAFDGSTQLLGEAAGEEARALWAGHSVVAMISTIVVLSTRRRAW